MKKDLIIGVVTGLPWEELRAYVISLSRCGFRGEKVLLVNRISEETRAHLLRYGFTLVDYEIPLKASSFKSDTDVSAWTYFGFYRYKVLVDYLAPLIDRLRYVIVCDVRDLMFQLDPTDWLDEHRGKEMVVGRECWRIGDQPHNAAWMKFTAPDDFPVMKEYEVLCAGCCAGRASTVLEFLQAMWADCQERDIRSNDQGVFNWLLRQDAFVNRCFAPSMADGFIATGWSNKRYLPHAYSTDAPPVYNASDYVVYTPDGTTPFCIVHQYDRDANWRRCIDMIMEAADKAVV